MYHWDVNGSVSIQVHGGLVGPKPFQNLFLGFGIGTINEKMELAPYTGWVRILVQA